MGFHMRVPRRRLGVVILAGAALVLVQMVNQAAGLGPWAGGDVRGARDGVVYGELSSPADGGVAGGDCTVTALHLVADPCFSVGELIELEVLLTDPTSPIIGGQFFLRFDTVTFDVVSLSPGDAPFTFEFPGWLADEELGIIDYAVGSFTGGTMADTVMARIVLEVVDDSGVAYLAFRENSPPNRLADEDGFEVSAELIDAGAEADVDMTDFTAFQRCFSGDAVPATVECQCAFDLEGFDGDVDLLDYAAFQATLTGPSYWECGG